MTNRNRTIAENTIHHSKEYPSHLILPVNAGIKENRDDNY